MSDHILYTYSLAAGEVVCHAYGPADQATAQTEGQKLADEFHADPDNRISEFTFMVLPLEAMPS